jgi:hypothetical protein
VKARLYEESLVDIVVTNGGVCFNGNEIDNSLTKRIVQLANEGRPIAPLVNFLRNLLDNPSFRAIQDLYTFLEYGGMPLTPDGHFLAYKAIAANWKDIHSGTFDNSIGATVQMARNQVDEDPTRTCSAGLHVCSYAYLDSYAHADGHIVVVKINPADVVAIPTDYNNTKMRVSRYVVVEEVEGWYKQREDQLRSCNGFSPDWDEYDDSDDDSDYDSDEETDEVLEDKVDEDGEVVTVYMPVNETPYIIVNIGGAIAWFADPVAARKIVQSAKDNGAPYAFGLDTKTNSLI